jgi:hypothetical protein
MEGRCKRTTQENDPLNSSSAITIISTNLSNSQAPALVVILYAVKKAMIQQGRKGTYSQTEYGKNALVVADGGDGEHSTLCISRRRCAREDQMDLREGRKEQLARDDGGGVDSR